MEQIVILDFGSQFTQVIARRIRECHVYSTILRYDTPASTLAGLTPKGLILSGGPSSVYAKDAPMPAPAIFDLGIPILGICYGVQLLTHFLGGKVEPGQKREYGKGALSVKDPSSALFAKLPGRLQIWNSHGDKLTRMPKGFKAVAASDNSEFAAIEDPRPQFLRPAISPRSRPHPARPRNHRQFRPRHLRLRHANGPCAISPTRLSRKSRPKSAANASSSASAAAWIPAWPPPCSTRRWAAASPASLSIMVCCARARPPWCAGFSDAISSSSSNTANASRLFLGRLKGVTDPERKRKIIGKTFIKVFTRRPAAPAAARFLAQGTLYPDVIESVPIAGNPAALIKSHHNVGGLPKNLKFKLIEPLKCLFKDEVRQLGQELGLPKEILFRQPFPGPGLAVRILGAVTPRRCDILRAADWIVIEEMKNSGWYYKIWQSFAILLPVRSVGVMGDERTYENTIAIRAVESQDGMTADWAKLPYDLLERLSNRIINEVKGVNRVCLDISSKPPATIEWE